MSSDDFDHLFKSLEVHIEESDLAISSVEHCNGKTIKSAYVTFDPHFIQNSYQESYYFYCTRSPSSTEWRCQKPTILKSIKYQGSTIRMFGSVSAAEANELIQFIASISKESFSSLKDQELLLPSSDISGYKKIYAISKEQQAYEVTVEGGEGGNTLIIKRVQCGLKQCDLGVSNVVWVVY
jgi:hypothetical protein